MDTPELAPDAVSVAPTLSPEARGAAPGRARLAGKRLLVVGGGQSDFGLTDPPVGNGRAISLLCAREGASVVVSDIDASAAETTCELARRDGDRAVAVVGDATDEEDVQRVVSEAVEELGGIDGLVLAVGALRVSDPPATEDWDWMFNLNVRSHFLVSKHAIPLMPPGSSVVIISSIAAHAPLHEIAAYHASKAGSESLKNVLARQYGPGVRVNAVAPGWIDTPMGRAAWASSKDLAELAKQRVGSTTLKRKGTGWEVAYPTVFLLSDEASYITGQTLLVDGGWVALRA